MIWFSHDQTFMFTFGKRPKRRALSVMSQQTLERYFSLFIIIFGVSALTMCFLWVTTLAKNVTTPSTLKEARVRHDKKRENIRPLDHVSDKVVSAGGRALEPDCYRWDPWRVFAARKLTVNRFRWQLSMSVVGTAGTGCVFTYLRVMIVITCFPTRIVPWAKDSIKWSS